MDRKETAERIKIMQAFVDGKQIEYRDSIGEWRKTGSPVWSPDTKYRIKPESMYRPFKDKEECWQEIQKHQPFGWIKASHGYFNIIGIMDDRINFGIKDNWVNYEHMFKTYKFIDGTPFGIKEE